MIDWIVTVIVIAVYTYMAVKYSAITWKKGRKYFTIALHALIGALLLTILLYTFNKIPEEAYNTATILIITGLAITILSPIYPKTLAKPLRELKAKTQTTLSKIRSKKQE